MRTALHLLIIMIVAVPFLTGARNGDPVVLGRDKLGRDVEGIHANVAIFSANGREFYVRLYLAEAGRGVDPVHRPDDAVGHQLIPSYAEWEVTSPDGAERRWLCRFLRNRDRFYHTIVTLPLDELKRSRLRLTVPDTDAESSIDVIVDLGEMQWVKSQNFVWQAGGTGEGDESD